MSKTKIKIIKKGPGNVGRKKQCKSCGVTVEYVPKDVQEYHGTDVSGGPDGSRWIICPSCKGTIILESW
jgi:hypothetical protein